MIVDRWTGKMPSMFALNGGPTLPTTSAAAATTERCAPDRSASSDGCGEQSDESPVKSSSNDDGDAPATAVKQEAHPSSDESTSSTKSED